MNNLGVFFYTSTKCQSTMIIFYRMDIGWMAEP